MNRQKRNILIMTIIIALKNAELPRIVIESSRGVGSNCAYKSGGPGCDSMPRDRLR
jgi:hypothetical protein